MYIYSASKSLRTISTIVVISLNYCPDVKCLELSLRLSASCQEKPTITLKHAYSNWLVLLDDGGICSG